MAISPSRELTEQFYQWEQLGRGHLLSSGPACLEPPFTPFFEHAVDRAYIDDGVHPGFFERLFPKKEEQGVTKLKSIDTDGIDDTYQDGHDVIQVAIPKNHSVKSGNVEQFLSLLAKANTPVSFEIVALADRIVFQFVIRKHASHFVRSQMQAFFSDCVFIDQEDALVDGLDLSKALFTVDFGLSEEFTRPIGTGLLSANPYTSFFAIVEHLKPGEIVVWQVLFCGTVNEWYDSVINAVSNARGGSFFFDAPEMPRLAQQKVSYPFVAAAMRLLVIGETERRASDITRQCSLSLMHGSSSDSNSLTPIDSPEYELADRLSDFVERQSHRLGMLLNTSELATLVHLPSASVSKKLFSGKLISCPAPTSLLNHNYILGINEHQGQSSSVGLSAEDRVRHIHVLGSTGVGKSTLLHSLIMQDISRDIGCCILDCHGDLIDNILVTIPRNRIDDVILIDPSDSGCLVPLNILNAHSDAERELLASDLVALFRRFSTSWGDQLHSVFANAILAFLFNDKDGHLGDLRKFLIDKDYRNERINSCTDPELIYYWKKEYPLLKTSSVGSILTRLDSFLRPRVIRNMVCQKSSLNFSEIMDTGKILLVKLSQGLIGSENSYLLGSLIISKLQQCAIARQRLESSARVPFFCYIDEFHNFITPSISQILGGARKYNLGLVLAHQDLQQISKIDPEITNGVLSNASTRICFRIGDLDAKRLKDGFTHFTADDLQNLDRGEALVRVHTSDCDCNITIMPWKTETASLKDEIIRQSKTKYSVGATVSGVVQEERTEENPNVGAIPQDEPEAFRHHANRSSSKPAPPEVNASLHDSIFQAAEKEQATKHRYLQSFIKQLAQDNGYKADIEVLTPDGRGQVDVVFEKEGMAAAVEISVSTNALWELHNLKKCLNAGYSQVIICTDDLRKKDQIRSLIETGIHSEHRKKILLISPEQIPDLFTSKSTNPESLPVKKGYRIKVKYNKTGDKHINDIISRIVSSNKNSP